MEWSKKERIGRWILWILLGATVAFIFWHSAQSPTASDKESSLVTEFLRKLFHNGNISHAFIRKLAHFTEYFGLGAELSVLLWIEKRRTKQRYLGYWSATGFVALCDETVQIFSDRGPAIKDVWIDFAGATAGMLLILLLRMLTAKIKGRKKQ